MYITIGMHSKTMAKHLRYETDKSRHNYGNNYVFTLIT